MKKRHCTLILAAAALHSLAGTSRASIVVNGDFELGTTVDGTTGDLLPVGWFLGPPTPATLSKVNVDTTVNAPTDLGPQSGTHYLRFQSTSTNGSRDCVEQDLTTVAGQQYTVTFSVAITSTSVGNFLGLNPVWDENGANSTTMGATAFYFAPTNTGPVPYQTFSFIETASTNVTRIDFHGIDTNGSILVDNVSVTPTPEPASALLVGAGVVLAATRRPCRR